MHNVSTSSTEGVYIPELAHCPRTRRPKKEKKIKKLEKYEKKIEKIKTSQNATKCIFRYHVGNFRPNGG